MTDDTAPELAESSKEKDARAGEENGSHGKPETPPTAGNAEPQTASPARRGRGAFVLSALALALSAVALGAAGWLAWQDRASDASAADNEAAIAGLAEGVADARGSLRNLESQAAKLRAGGDEQSEAISAIKRELDRAREQNQSLARRIAALEGAVASLRGVSAGVRETWALAEAEYYMQIANAQLQLAGNRRNAALALEFADERLRELADPGLSEVRRALSREMQSLEAMEPVDLEGITLSLSALADRVGALPLDEQVRPTRGGESTAEAEAGNTGGWERALASVKRAFGDIVSVRRTDESAAPLMSPDSAWFLRANLALKFEAARLALLKTEPAVFRQSLTDAARWLQKYYDTDSRAVASALETIRRLQREIETVSFPDISTSLRLLRQHRALSNTGTSAAAPEREEGFEGERGR